MPADVWHIARAAASLRQGGIIVHATEAVFGLAACAYDMAACTRVAALKQRDATQHFIVICQSLEQIDVLGDLATPLQNSILASWPGPHTWIVPARSTAPRWLLNDDGCIALRMTAHTQAAALCRRAGPLISTSANPHGRPPARTLRRALHYFGASVDCYVPGQVAAAARPSTIRDGSTGKVLRA